MEQRYNSLEISSANGRKLSGYAATYNTASSPDALLWREKLAPGCFRNALRSSDAVCLLNHYSSEILGRQSAGTLRLSEDERGLRFECDLPESPLGENVRVALQRGDLRECSFGFTVADDGDEWGEDYDGTPTRTIRNIRSLSDVSVVTFPAYPGTSAMVRSLFPGGVPPELRTRFPEMAKLSPREAGEKRYQKKFNGYLLGKVREDEMRFTANEYWGRPISESFTGGDLQGGTTSGVAGGYTVPVEFMQKMRNAMAQYTDLMHDELVTLDVSKDYSLRGKVFPAWDLSTYKAQRVGEVTQVSPNDTAIPAAYAKFQSGKIYRASLAIALELEQDSAADGNIITSLTKAFAVAMGRGIGVDLIGGNGETGSGLLAGAVDSQINAPLDLDFLYNVYFSLNRYHRASSKCAWVMHDDVYQSVRRLKDADGRPLINIDEDGEKIFGKRVVVSPDMPNSAATSSPAVAGKVIFGNLEHFIVRISQMTVTRTLQSGLASGVGDITRGEALLNGRMRADSVVLDASLGAVPPIIYASFPTRN